jgi:RNA polymerase sigma-B factor
VRALDARVELAGQNPRLAACDLLVSRHRNVAWSCVQQYRRSSESAEDLIQVGYVGLLKAINNFDPAFNSSLAAYARPCITGEIRRHFRDMGWQVHLARSMKKLVLQVRAAERQLTRQLGHMPADAELASHLGLSDRDIRDARRAELVLRPWSLDAPLGGLSGAASLVISSVGRIRRWSTCSACGPSPRTGRAAKS